MRRAMTQLGVYAASPFAFFIVAIYVALWAFFRLDTLDWHAGATIATWCMTLVIQRAEHRDTQAIHAKLDEILHASKASEERSSQKLTTRNRRRSKRNARRCAETIDRTALSRLAGKRAARDGPFDIVGSSFRPCRWRPARRLSRRLSLGERRPSPYPSCPQPANWCRR